MNDKFLATDPYAEMAMSAWSDEWDAALYCRDVLALGNLRDRVERIFSIFTYCVDFNGFHRASELDLDDARFWWHYLSNRNKGDD